MKMKRNIGSIDRTARAAAAVVIAVLYFTGTIRGTLSIVLGLVALALLFTSITAFCSLYTLLGISTVKKGKSGESDRL